MANVANKYGNILVFSKGKLIKCYPDTGSAANEFVKYLPSKRDTVVNGIGNALRKNKQYYGLDLKCVSNAEYIKADEFLKNNFYLLEDFIDHNKYCMNIKKQKEEALKIKKELEVARRKERVAKENNLIKRNINMTYDDLDFSDDLDDLDFEQFQRDYFKETLANLLNIDLDNNNKKY